MTGFKHAGSSSTLGSLSQEIKLNICIILRLWVHVPL